MPWLISIVCIIIAVFCIVKLQRKQQLDIQQKLKYEQEVQLLEHRKNALKNDIDFCEAEISKEQRRYEQIQNEHNRILAQKAIELDNFYDKSKQRRMEQLENEMLTQEKLFQQNLQKEEERCAKEAQILQDALDTTREDANQKVHQLEENEKFLSERFLSLLTPLKQYEMEKQQRLYYTIQVPEEYHNDIDYLLTTVSQKVQHPDIINKLVWSEYIKPAMDETIKRVGIEDKSGIYKITSLEDGKCYIGKSTNIKKRLQDHFKSSIGITAIADQAVHHAILKQGIWNWTIEIITYCDKDKLNELEKYYIDFFKAQEYGYNKNSGGGG